jgi:hypothetical protein
MKPHFISVGTLKATIMCMNTSGALRNKQHFHENGCIRELQIKVKLHQ